jgi:hypothetical protein
MKTLLQFSLATTRQLISYKWVQLSFIFLFTFSLATQAQIIEWDKTYGSNGEEAISFLKHTSDGGYILGGASDSGIFGEKSEASRGESDYWVVKIDADGDKEWDRTFGGNDFDGLTSLQQTSDGGYILGGYSYSGISSDKAEASRGESDYWVIKLDANGNKQWDKTFGGDDFDGLTSLQQTIDGGYLVGGTSSSGVSGDRTAVSRGASDYWILKLDANGNKVWDKAYGGSEDESLSFIKHTDDGGFILGGTSSSGISGDKTEASRGESDFWVVKIDADGNMQWNRTFGGSESDRLSELQQTMDGGYMLAGTSSSGISGDKTEANKGECDSRCSGDYWIVKLDQNGNKEWDRTYGSADLDVLSSMRQTIDGGYILGGYSYAEISGDKTEPNRGTCFEYEGFKNCSSDYWLLKIDISGNTVWDRTLGGDNYDELYALDLTQDGGYLVGGGSLSGVSGDKTEESRGPGGSDFWVVKVSGELACTPPSPSIKVIPSSKVYTGGDPTRIYLGYGPQSVRLLASGAESYEWSPATGLSSTTVADPVFTPTAAGSYTFTVTAYNGTCSATSSVTITVEDVRCGKGKVLVCHNGKPICISPAAVEAHLRNHRGDKLGNCTPVLATDHNLIIALKTYPNPFRDRTNIEFSLNEDGNYRLELYNANGKMLGIVAQGRGKTGNLVQHELEGKRLMEGVHYLRLITENEIQTVRLILKK